MTICMIHQDHIQFDGTIEASAGGLPGNRTSASNGNGPETATIHQNGHQSTSPLPDAPAEEASDPAQGEDEPEAEVKDEDSRPILPPTPHGMLEALKICELDLRFNLRSLTFEVTPTNRCAAAEYAVVLGKEPAPTPDGAYEVSDFRLDILRVNVLPRKVRRGRKKGPVPYHLSAEVFKANLRAISGEIEMDPFVSFLREIDKNEPDPGPEIWRRLFTECLLTEPTEEQPASYLEHVARLHIIPQIARAERPGQDSRTVPVLIGGELTGKSTLGRAAFPEGWQGVWFTDDFSFASDSRERIESTSGAVTVEASEMSGLDKGLNPRQKAAVSRVIDKARMAYARVVSTVPRRFALVGTANDEGVGILPPDTQNTRWLVATISSRSTPHHVDMWMERNRRALWKRGLTEWKEWAKAKAAADANREEGPIPPWWLTPEVLEIQGHVNADYVAAPAGVEILVSEIEIAAIADPAGARDGGRPLAEWLWMVKAFGDIPLAEAAQKVSAGHASDMVKAVASALKRKGWDSGNKRRKGKQGMRWWPPEKLLAEQD